MTWTIRIVCSLILFGVISSSIVFAQQPARLLSNRELAPIGLKREWHNQIRLDPRGEVVVRSLLHDNTIFLVTNASVLIAVDGSSGKTMWRQNLGHPGLVTLEPAANSRMVAVICGMELLIFDRRNGKLVWSIGLPETPGAGCALSETYAYIPTMSGKLVAYYLRSLSKEPEPVEVKQHEPDLRSDLSSLKEAFRQAREEVMKEEVSEQEPARVIIDRSYHKRLSCPSFGSVLVPPTMTSQYLKTMESKTLDTPIIDESTEFVSWASDRGIMHIASVNRDKSEFGDAILELRHQVKMMQQLFYTNSSHLSRQEVGRGNDIVSQPTFSAPVPYNTTLEDEIRKGVVLVGTIAGYVHAISDRTGDDLWQFYAGAPVIERVAVICDRMFEGNEWEFEIDKASLQDAKNSLDGVTLREDVFICTEKGMSCVDLRNGDLNWFAPFVTKFVAASKERVYCFTNTLKFSVLDRRTGGLITSFDANPFYEQILFNIETDSVFLLSKSGLVQCLREIRAEEPEIDEDGKYVLSNGGSALFWHRMSCKELEEKFLAKRAEIRKSDSNVIQRPEQIQENDIFNPGTISPGPGGAGDDDFFGGGSLEDFGSTPLNSEDDDDDNGGEMDDDGESLFELF